MTSGGGTTPVIKDISTLDAILGDHHKVTRDRGTTEWLVESFRRADWVDVTRGRLDVRCVAIANRRALCEMAGRRLSQAPCLQLELIHLRKHPLNPLPVFRF